MSINSFGHLFRVTTWGESHGPALGATVDGCPPGVTITEEMIQHWMDKRKPGQNKYTTQGVFNRVFAAQPWRSPPASVHRKGRPAPRLAERQAQKPAERASVGKDQAAWRRWQPCS